MIKIPLLFAKKLELKPLLAADVRKSFELFEPWLEHSGMPFFPGFTDHSPRHINEVLTTAASLIADDSHELLSAEDVAVLCMAVLLHDCGMHITQDAFRKLVSNSDSPLIPSFDDLPWGQLWKDFLSEAKRFGQEKLIAVFGDSQPVSISNFDMDDLSERDCLLIGEFIRRHHTRLAHEIAIQGVSKFGSAPIRLSFDDVEICDLAGLVARSHGMSIRETFNYLEEKYSTIATYRNIKAPYLMAVLRIADYVQVQSERAIRTLLSVKELRSPVSRQEWLNHFAVKDVTTEHADPEAFHVNAAPADVKTYLRLTALFKDIQRELDESWATLGEVYGRSKTLHLLGLTIRRIRSNLDNKEKFARAVQYIPLKANFDSSGPDLLRLLVGPLYEYQYGVGIRELIQNAVDASRERLSFLNSSGDDLKLLLSVDVQVEETHDGTGWITISDNGVGMTLETVIRYFLIAGASFRNSDAWKRQHVDDEGQPRIVRGGRFGVGALAAFLLGDEIQVTTRHVNRDEVEGVTFSARIDDPVVQLNRCSAPIGTKIKIFVSNKEVFEGLRPASYDAYDIKEGLCELRSWAAVDWYVHRVPELRCSWRGFNFPEHKAEGRLIYKGKYQLNSNFNVPDIGENEAGWELLPDSAPYRRIIWRYCKEVFDRKKYGFISDEISLNGIRVKNNNAWRTDSHLILPPGLRIGELNFSITRPTMAISDPAGICPINLQRNAIAFERMGIDVKLAHAILTRHFERLFKQMPTCMTFAELYKFHDILKSAVGVTYDCQVGPICCTRDGIMLFTHENLRLAKVNTVMFIDADLSESNSALLDFIGKDEALVLRFQDGGLQAWTNWFRAFFDTYSQIIPSYNHREIGIPFFVTVARGQFVLGENWTYVNTKKRVARHLLDALDYAKVGDHVFLSTRDGMGIQLQQRCAKVAAILPRNAEIGLWVLKESEPLNMETSLLQIAWNASFGGQYFKCFV
jgi:molecular chaperone HtpG